MWLTGGVLGFSAKAFYDRNKNPLSCRDVEDAYAINALIDARGDDLALGSRFLADVLAGRRRVRGTARMATLFPAELVVRDREEGPQRQATRATCQR